MNRNTILVNPEGPDAASIHEIMVSVYKSLEEKGYDPIAQLSGYILSGDPSYITSHNNARSLIKHIDRDDLVEELIKKYLDLSRE